MLLRFLFYGLLGWAIEIVWTAVGRTLEESEARWRLAGTTYLWMFPIYGSIAFLYEPVHDAIRAWAWPLRGTLYAAGFMTVEFLTGWTLRRTIGLCPWDYTGRCRWHVLGLVRLDYAPAWALLGLALEPVHDFLVRAVSSVS